MALGEVTARRLRQLGRNVKGVKLRHKKAVQRAGVGGRKKGQCRGRMKTMKRMLELEAAPALNTNAQRFGAHMCASNDNRADAAVSAS